MGQVSKKLDLNPPNVRSRCILANIYKAKKQLDQGGRGREFGGEKQKRKRNHSVISSSSNWTWGQTLS